jgi:hypothetical protein
MSWALDVVEKHQNTFVLAYDAAGEQLSLA